MAAVLEEPPLDAGHPLRVEIPLELGGETQLAEQVAAGGPVELGTREVRDMERHVALLELVVQLEHEPGVAGQARQVVDDDRGDLTGGERPEESLVAVAGGAEA
jgi:hypothetical protein